MFHFNRKNPFTVWEEIIALPKPMTGEKIIENRKNIIANYEVKLLPYEKGLSIEDKSKNIRFCLDLSSSPGGRIGRLTQCVLIGDYGEPLELVPVEKTEPWAHLKKTTFNKIKIIFFKTRKNGWDKKRIRGRLPSELALALFAK